LLAADVGVKATEILVEKVKHATGDRREILETEIARLLSPKSKVESPKSQPPLVVMIVGVNGSGKTTTVGKLCRLFADQGQRVVVAAADTYRDAAAEQLGIWAKRAGVEIVSSVQGQDAAAVAFDTIQKAVQKSIDVVLVDTAGRLHTRKDLMDEAVKIKRVCAKVKPGAPDEVWLVLDATVGQNGLRQAAAFNEQLGLTGLVVTKLDGTAKGGVLIPIVMELSVPVRFTGTGEGLDDIEPFDPQAYAKALFEE
jgi:fused signal recognition particle receptor